MKLLQLNKGRQAADVVIVINKTVYDTVGAVEVDKIYDQEAKLLFDVLVSNLPGGTYDALCLRLKRYWGEREDESRSTW
jgi:hypothetical protein